MIIKLNLPLSLDWMVVMMEILNQKCQVSWTKISMLWTITIRLISRVFSLLTKLLKKSLELANQISNHNSANIAHKVICYHKFSSNMKIQPWLTFKWCNLIHNLLDLNNLMHLWFHLTQTSLTKSRNLEIMKLEISNQSLAKSCQVVLEVLQILKLLQTCLP